MLDSEPMQNAIVPRATVATLVRARNEILGAFREAFAARIVANDSIKAATNMLTATTPGINNYNYHLKEEKLAFHRASNLPDVTAYMATARRITDTDIWSHIIAITDLERIMDKKAKDQFRQQLIDDPPEITEDNIFATLQTFMGDAPMIFKRGIAECFSQLDRRFRSHDGWEIGSRIILTFAFDEWGSWNYHRNHRDTFADIERVFKTIDDSPAYSCEIVDKMNEARAGGLGKRQTEIETDYFTIRAFKNGNAHVWFKRDDLLAKVNQLLGEYYGAPIPEDREPDPNTGLYDPKTLPAKRYGFFPTPDAAADFVMEEVLLHRSNDDAEQYRVLEPSAGTGNLAGRCVEKGAVVDCVEIQPDLAANLARVGLYERVYRADFLQLSPETTGLYDRVVMNPPFDRERDIDHVMHALKFLKPGGTLVAIMSAGTEFRNTRKSQAFREHMLGLKKGWHRDFRQMIRDLPAGSFSSVGTNCNTILLTVTI